MSAHFLYVSAAYGIAVFTLAALTLWIAIDARARKRELERLEASGIRRRSDKRPANK